MRGPRWIAPLFVGACLMQLALPAAMIGGRERTLARGEVYRFETAPVDPYDPFRGRYVALRLAVENEWLPVRGTLGPRDRGFATLEIDDRGFARLGEIRDTPPDDADYVRGRVGGVRDGKARFDMPIERYYMPETRAPEAERITRERNADAPREAWAGVRVLEGRTVIEQLYVDGVPIDELLGR